MRPVLFGVWFFLLLCSLFVAIVGIQVIRLRNWARISLLVVAGCLLFFGVIGVGVIVVTLYVTPSRDPLVSTSLLAVVLAVTYGIPIAISIWWLILFTRRSVVAQFHSSMTLAIESPAASAFRLSHPACPLAIRIVGWYLASFVLIVPFLPFFLGQFPAFFFGRVFQGPYGVLFFVLYFALLFVPGFGLLLLKRWSYPLAVASQLFVCANGLSATLSPAYAEMFRSILAKASLPELSSTAEKMLNYSRYFNLLSLTIPVAILITLLVVRRDFFAAANRESAN
jgi:hypothetical protein